MYLGSSFKKKGLKLSLLISLKQARCRNLNRQLIRLPFLLLGKLLVERLLKQPETSVRALVRCPDKAADLLPVGSNNLEVVTVADLTTSSTELTRACVGASAAVWCATGFADDTSFLNKLRTFVGLQSYPKKVSQPKRVACCILYSSFERSFQ
jgi:hypothetical protein